MELLDELLIDNLGPLFLVHELLVPFYVEGLNVCVGLQEGLRLQAAHLEYGS